MEILWRRGSSVLAEVRSEVVFEFMFVFCALWRRWSSVLAELRSEVVSRVGKMDCQGSSLGTKVC